MPFLFRDASSMKLRKVLTTDCLRLNLPAASKRAAIAEMLDILIAAGKVRPADRAAVLEALLKREQKMSTGMQNGVAIPHAKCPQVDGLRAAVALKQEGLDFESLDGQPSRIFVMTVSPLKGSGPHIQFLAEISRIISEPGMRDRLLSAGSVSEVYTLLTQG